MFKRASITFVAAIIATTASSETQNLLFDCTRPSFLRNDENRQKRANDILDGTISPKSSSQAQWALRCLDPTGELGYHWNEDSRSFARKTEAEIRLEQEQERERKRQAVQEELERAALATAEEEQRAQEMDRLECVLLVREEELRQLEWEEEFIKEQRSLEAARETWRACLALYQRREQEALLNSVCSPLFLSNGIPDTTYEATFSSEALLNAQDKLVNARSELRKFQLDDQASEPLHSQISEYEKCKILIGE